MDGEQRRRLVSWVGVEPERVEAAAVRLDGDRLAAHGTSTTSDWTVTYRLRTGPDWVTERLDVHVDDRHAGRRLSLFRGDDGWSATRRDEPDDGPVRAWSVELPDLERALDCDLGLSPLTNTMPILRTGSITAAQDGPGGPVDIRVAWVSVPDLEVTADDQRYAVDGPVVGGGALVRFSANDFVSDIEVDADGLVVNYPGIARRLTG